MSKPYLVTIQRTNPLGETVAVEIELDSRLGLVKEWQEKVKPAFDLCDVRLSEMNMRILKVTQATMQLDPRTSDIVRKILLMTNGFSPPDVDAVQDKVVEGGNMRAKQWVDDVSPRDEDGAKLTFDEGDVGPGRPLIRVAR